MGKLNGGDKRQWAVLAGLLCSVSAFGQTANGQVPDTQKVDTAEVIAVPPVPVHMMANCPKSEHVGHLVSVELTGVKEQPQGIAIMDLKALSQELILAVSSSVGNGQDTHVQGTPKTARGEIAVPESSKEMESIEPSVLAQAGYEVYVKWVGCQRVRIAVGGPAEAVPIKGEGLTAVREEGVQKVAAANFWINNTEQKTVNSFVYRAQKDGALIEYTYTVSWTPQKRQEAESLSASTPSIVMPKVAEGEGATATASDLPITVK